MSNSTKQFCIITVMLLFTMPISSSEISSGIKPDDFAPGEIGLQEIYTTSFVSRWNTTLISEGSSDSNQIMLPIYLGGIYNFDVDWGDSNVETITSYAQNIHTYDSEGVYDVVINGSFTGWQFNDDGDRLKIIEISQWGNINLGNKASYFDGCENLVLTATDSPDLTGTTNMYEAFDGCYSLGDTGSMDSWNMSLVTKMTFMFSLATSFNQDISGWNVSSVTDMWGMFVGAYAFNQPIGDWDVSSVTDMTYLFRLATSFNQDISGWDVSSATDMMFMFYGASSFNQPIGSWDVSSATRIYCMFTDAISFNQPIGNWDISGVTDLSSMFSRASSFNQSLENWDVSGVIDMDYMFNEASSFNQPLENWDVSGVTSMRFMFGGASSFNQLVGNWDVSLVESMYCMFHDITLSTTNYDDLLISWAELSLQQSVAFHGGDSQYTTQATVARQSIIDTFSWIISDGGLLEFTPPDLSSPDDISYEVGIGVNEILWTVGDQNPHSYNITKDGTLKEQGYWSNGSIYVSVDDLAIGAYEYAIYVNDDSGNMASDTVIVTVTEKSTSDTSSTDTSTSDTSTSDTPTSGGDGPAAFGDDPVPIDPFIFIFSLAVIVIIHRKRR